MSAHAAPSERCRGHWRTAVEIQRKWGGAFGGGLREREVGVHSPTVVKEGRHAPLLLTIKRKMHPVR